MTLSSLPCVRRTTCISCAVMRYRVLLPQQHLILDALFAAVLLTILGLTSSIFIQALVDSVFVLGQKPAFNCLGLGMLLVSLARAGFFAPRSYLSTHLRRRIDAETVIGYHRHLLGLPLTFSSSRTLGVLATLIVVAIVLAYS